MYGYLLGAMPSMPKRQNVEEFIAKYFKNNEFK